MRKGKILRILNETDDLGNNVNAIVSPIESEGAEYRCIIPFYLRGKNGNLSGGTEVVFETFIDGTSLILQRCDGNAYSVIYGNPLKLGDDSATNYVALANKVKDALDALKDFCTQHSHPATSGTTSPSTQSLILDTDVASEKVKAK